MPKQNDTALYLYGTINSIHIWLLILSVVGFFKKHLNVNNRFLRFTNQAVYPFYILHQTIIVAAGFYIVQLNLPIVIKLIILVLITFISVFLIYRLIIKPFIITRVLYGLKPKEKRNNNFPKV